MFRSATFKLTLWYVLLACCLSLLFSVVVFHLSTGDVDDVLNHQYSNFVSNQRAAHDGDNLPSPNAELQRYGRHLLVELAWFNVVVIASSSIGGYFLARRTLRPIETAHLAQIRFTAEASHELRTPLAAMRADTEVALMSKGLPAKARSTLMGNLTDIERLEQLTRRLLDIARYQSKSRIEPVLLDFDDIVQQAIGQLSFAAREKHIEVVQKIHPVQVMGEQHGLYQLVTIVIDNAIKYSKPKDTVKVSLNKDDSTVTLTVQDNGIGVPVDDLPHVFESFYRSKNAKSDKKLASGYGLGLPLAQQIANMHGGAIHMQSRESKGTTVWVTLPIARD